MTRMRTVKVTVMRMRTVKVTVTCMRTVKVTMTRMRTVKVTVTHMHNVKVTVMRMRTVKVTVTCMRTVKVTVTRMHTVKVTVTRMRTVKVTVTCMRTVKVTVTCMRTVKVTVTRMRTVKVAVMRMRTVKVTVTCMRTVKVTVPRMRTVKVAVTCMHTVKVTVKRMRTVKVTVTCMRTVKVTVTRMRTVKVSVMRMHTVKVAVMRMRTVKVAVTRMRTIQVRVSQATMDADFLPDSAPAYIRNHMLLRPTQANELPWLPSDTWSTCFEPRANGTSPVRFPRLTQFTPDDWRQHNEHLYSWCQNSRQNSERQRLETLKFLQAADQQTQRTQCSTNHSLAERVKDISFWRNMLRSETDDMFTETTALNKLRERLERTLVELQRPLQVVQQCLFQREKRMDRDLVHDEVDKQLLQEEELVRSYQLKMKEQIEKSNRQLAENRLVLCNLGKDLDDKWEAQYIDEKCYKLRIMGNLSYFPNETLSNITALSPESWAKSTEQNITHSESERAASLHQRRVADELLKFAPEDLWRKYITVNTAFKDRISDMIEARDRLQCNLTQTQQEIFHTELLIEKIRAALWAKKSPMRVAQFRLMDRTHRPTLELCHDTTQIKLINEVQEIQDTVHHLECELKRAEETRAQLLRTKTSLERDLLVKGNSLFIDRERCMGLRRSYPMSHQALGGHP
uniref:tektin-3-like n=1 Tax=Myxine glutinosa TaxID=7769 RepID=UPI00358EC908